MRSGNRRAVPTLTTTAAERARYYHIKPEEVEAVMAEPDQQESGNRPDTLKLTKFVDERTIVVISNWERTIAVTCYIPDDEWSELGQNEIRFTNHARERMELLELNEADVELILARPDATDYDAKGNRRAHKSFRGRYIIAVQDPDTKDVVSVFARDTIWKDVRDTELPTVEANYSDIIGDLRRQLHEAQKQLREATEERDELRRWAERVVAWIRQAPRIGS